MPDAYGSITANRTTGKKDIPHFSERRKEAFSTFSFTSTTLLIETPFPLQTSLSRIVYRKLRYHRYRKADPSTAFLNNVRFTHNTNVLSPIHTDSSTDLYMFDSAPFRKKYKYNQHKKSNRKCKILTILLLKTIG